MKTDWCANARRKSEVILVSVKDAMTYKKNCPLCGGIVYVKSTIMDGLSTESARAPLYAKWQCQNCGAEFEQSSTRTCGRSIRKPPLSTKVRRCPFLAILEIS